MSDVKSGKNFAVSSVTNGVVQIVAPASNTDGLYLRSCTLGVNGGVEANLFADTAAPTGNGDNTKRRIFMYTSAVLSSEQMPFSLFIPAGMGIWLTTAGANGGSVTMSWDLVG